MGRRVSWLAGCCYCCLVAARVTTATATAEYKNNADDDVDAYCNCQFTVPADWEPYCRVFGQHYAVAAATAAAAAEETGGSERLVAFERANQTCIDQLAVDGALPTLTYSNEMMWAMCPFANGTNTNVQMAMNEIQNSAEKSTAVRAIQRLLPAYFRPASSSTATPAIGVAVVDPTPLFVLQDVIYDARTSPVDCQAASRNCWSAIREFVSVNATLRSLVCQQFHIEHQWDNAEQQWHARQQLCAGTTMATAAACEPLNDRIAALKRTSIADAGSAGRAAAVDCASLFPRPNDTAPLNVAVCDFENPLPPAPPPRSDASLSLQVRVLHLLMGLSLVWAIR